MNCEQMENLISCYVDGELEKEHCDLLEQHIAGCSACRATLEAYRQIHEMCLQEDVCPPEGLRTEILAAAPNWVGCEDFEGIIPLLADGQAADYAAAASHAETCSHCARELQAYRALAGLCASVDLEAAPDTLRERIAACTYARKSLVSRISQFWSRPLRMAGAAGAVLVLVAALLMSQSGPEGPDSRQAGINDSVPAAPAGQPQSGSEAQSLTSAADAATVVEAVSAQTARERPSRQARRHIAPAAAASPKPVVAKLPQTTDRPPAAPVVEPELAPRPTLELMPEPEVRPAETEIVKPAVGPIVVASAEPEEVLARQQTSDNLNMKLRETIESRRLQRSVEGLSEGPHSRRVELRLLQARF